MTFYPAGELARTGHARRFWAGDHTASTVLSLPLDECPEDGVALVVEKFRQEYPNHPLCGPDGPFRED